MAFVERGWRSFLRTGDPDPTAWRGRMAGQLMTYEACTDPRAWCLSAHDRRQHLIDIMRRGPDDLDSMLPLPTETVARREPPIQRKRPEIKPPPTVKAAAAAAPPPPPPPPPSPPQPKTPPPKEAEAEAEAVQPEDVGVPRVEFTEEERPTVAEPASPPPTPTSTPPDVAEPEETAEELAPAPEPASAPPELRKTQKERAGDFCVSLTDVANEIDGMLRSKSVCQQVPRLYEICAELSNLATECAVLQSQMCDRTTAAECMVEAARAAADDDLMEELIENYENFDPTIFQMDIAQVRILEERLNGMRLESMVDDADEGDETWELRNLVAQLENRLEFNQDDARMSRGRAEDFSQTDHVSQGSEGGDRSYEPSEASSQESTIADRRESDELRAIIANLQRRIEILESERQEIRGRDTYEDREAAILRDQINSLTAERDNLVNLLNQARMEAEALKQENGSLVVETESIRQEMSQLQGEHLAALDYIKSLEEATAECTMLKEENKRMEDKLQQSTREKGKLHHEVHKLQCIIRDVEDDRKRTLNQLERLSYAAEWAKEAEQSLLEKDCKLDAREQEINDLLNTLEEISAEMDRCKNIEQSLEERNGELADQEVEISHLIKKIEELSAELENLKVANHGLEAERDMLKDANQGLEAERDKLKDANQGLEAERDKLKDANQGLEAERDKLKDIAEDCQKTADSMQTETMGVSDEFMALQQQILSLTEALAKQKEESEKLQTELLALKGNISVAEMTVKDGTKISGSASSITSLTNSAMRSMLKQARSALSVVMMELEDSGKNMEILVQKNKLLVAENEDLIQELESLGVRRRTTVFRMERTSGNEETLPRLSRLEEKRIRDERDDASDTQARKYKADEDLDVLRDELKACKADNEQLLVLISKLTAEGQSRESVKEEALLLQNQLQVERVRYQKMRDSFHQLQTSTENIMKEAAQAAVSDDRLKRMGEVHLLENQYKAQKLENEKLWKLIASLKSDTEKLRTVLPDNISHVSATICEPDNISEEMKNVCHQLIAAKDENKRLQDIVDNLRTGIDTLQTKLAETNTENVNLIMQNNRNPSGNEELKGQADDLSSRLTKFVADYPKQMPDTDSIKELTKEVKCLHEKLVVNITTCNIEAIKEENLRLENLLKEKETEIAGMREILSEKGIPVPAHLGVPLDVIKEPTKTDEGQIIDSLYDDTGKKLLSHLAEENLLLKKHLERRVTFTPEIISQLEEENELLKKQLSSEAHIIETVRKDTIQFLQKSIEEIKAQQQQSVEVKGVTDVTQQRCRTSFAGKTNENALRDQIESLHKQLDDANRMIRTLEMALDELRNTRAPLPVTGITEVAPQRGKCEKCRKSKKKTETETDLIGITAAIQQTDGQSIAEAGSEKILKDRIESLQRQLIDANDTLRSLQEATSTAETENERKLQNQIDDLHGQLCDANNIIRALEAALDEQKATGIHTVTEESPVKPIAETENEKILDDVQIPGTSSAETDNERILRNQVESLQKQLNDANNMVISLKSTLDELREENESMQVPVITDVAQQSHDTSAAEPENEMAKRNEIESLQKQLNDANGIVKSLEATVEELKNQIESLQNKLNASNTMVQELQDRVKKLTDENNVLKSNQTKDEITTTTTIKEAGGSAPSSTDLEVKIVMKQLTAENESLRKELEEARKFVHKTSDNETKYENIITALKAENQLLIKKIEDAREKQFRKPIEDPGTTKVINQMTQENELLKKQVEDLKRAPARPSSAGTSRDPAFEQLMKDNEALREMLENTRKRIPIPVTSVPQEATESEDIVKLRTDNEILRKQLEDARKMAQGSQEQILADDYSKIIDQLREENEFLKKRLESLTDIMSVSSKEVVKYVEKPVEVIKADTYSEKTITELRNLNESLQSELKDANSVRRELEEQIKKLKEEKQLEQEQITKTDQKTLDKDTSQLTEQNELLKKQLQDATNTIEDLTQNIIHLTDEIQRLQSTKVSGVEDHTQELQKLEAELQELRDENNRLKRDNEKLTLEIESLREDKVPSELIVWKTDEQQLESVVDEQKRRITTLLSKMSKREHPEDPGEVEAWKKEREHLLDMITQLRKELKESQEAVEEKDEMDARMQSLLFQMDAMKQKLDEQEKEAELGGTAPQDLQEENTKMKNQIESLNSELENMQQRLKDQEAELSRLTQLQDDNNRLKNELDSLKEELERLRAAGQAAEQVQGLSDENERLKKELEALKQDMGKLQAAEKEAEQAKTALEDNQRLKDENDKLKKELEALRAELDKLKSAQQAEQSLLDEINKLKGENEKLKSEAEEKAEQIKKLEGAAKEAGKDLSKELEALQEQLKQLQAEKQKLENELKECLEKNKTMEDKLKSLESADAGMKALQDELNALKTENKKLAEGGATDAKKLKEMEDECEAKLAALRNEHQKELERREQVHRENLETCQIELNELKGKLQESDKTLQLNLDKDKNKTEDAKEYEEEIARLQKQSEMLSKNLKADLEAKNAELDTLRFEMTKEINDLRKKLEKCMSDCEKYQKELEKVAGAPVSSEKSTVRVDKTKSEPLPTVKEETSERKDKEKKDKEKTDKERTGKERSGKERSAKEKTDKEKKEKKSKAESDETPAIDKGAKKGEGAAKKKGGPPSKKDGKPDTTSKSKLEESVPEGGKKVDGGVCRCMEHPLVKIIYKILHGGTEVLSTEDIIYLHKKLCAECRTALGPPRNEAQIRAHMRVLRKEILEREEKMTKEVAQLEESLHEGKLFLERLYERYTEKRKATQEAIEKRKMAPIYPQASAARRTASGTAIGNKNQSCMAPSIRPADPTAAAKMTVRCPG